MYLIFDIETTGLVKCKKFNVYPDYRNNEAYNSARIVQIAWTLIDSNYTTIDKKNYIVKRDGFNIPNSSFHGITNDISDIKGTKFEIIMLDFLEALKQTSIIVAHNILYDFNVLTNHLFRYNLQYVHSLFVNKAKFCTSMASANLLKIPMPYFTNHFKYPSLQELHTFYFGKKIINAHNAEIDVAATTKCFVLLFQEVCNRNYIA
jgi:DNA polymerase III epsilon subunit-like protein